MRKLTTILSDSKNIVFAQAFAQVLIDRTRNSATADKPRDALCYMQRRG